MNYLELKEKLAKANKELFDATQQLRNFIYANTQDWRELTVDIDTKYNGASTQYRFAPHVILPDEYQKERVVFGCGGRNTEGLGEFNDFIETLLEGVDYIEY